MPSEQAGAKILSQTSMMNLSDMGIECNESSIGPIKNRTATYQKYFEPRNVRVMEKNPLRGSMASFLPTLKLV
jgi:hypothetical protein